MTHHSELKDIRLLMNSFKVRKLSLVEGIAVNIINVGTAVAVIEADTNLDKGNPIIIVGNHFDHKDSLITSIIA